MNNYNNILKDFWVLKIITKTVTVGAIGLNYITGIHDNVCKISFRYWLQTVSNPLHFHHHCLQWQCDTIMEDHWILKQNLLPSVLWHELTEISEDHYNYAQCLIHVLTAQLIFNKND
jgi:hypothetical protein